MQSKEFEVSVVVPLYNTEKYVAKTLKSICAQDIGNFEIVIVNDGSKDNSAAEAERALKEIGFSDFRIVSQPNMGLPNTRNAGIKLATGKYVVCVDSDDYIQPDFLSSLVNACKSTKSPIAICSYQSVGSARFSAPAPENPNGIEIISREDMFFRFLYRKIQIVAPTIMIEREFFINNNLWYNTNVKFSEDSVFIWNLILTIPAIPYVKRQLYNYLVREGSMMRKMPFDKLLSGYAYYRDFSKKYTDSSLPLNLVSAKWVLGILNATTRMVGLSEFIYIAKKLEYRNYLKSAFGMQDCRIKLLSAMLYIHPSIFFVFAKAVHKIEDMRRK